MVEQKCAPSLKDTPRERIVFAPIRDFTAVTWDMKNPADRAVALRPGDYINMTLSDFAAWFGHVPSDRGLQYANGLFGFTRVTLQKIIIKEDGTGLNAIVRSDKDAPGAKRDPVDASLFSDYGSYVEEQVVKTPVSYRIIPAKKDN